MHELHLSKDPTRDKGGWRRLIYILDYWYSLNYLYVFLFLFFAFYRSFFYSFLPSYLYFIYIFLFLILWLRAKLVWLVVSLRNLLQLVLFVARISFFWWSFSTPWTLWPHPRLRVWVAAFLLSQNPDYSFLWAVYIRYNDDDDFLM